MEEVEVVILRISLTACNPGCLHLVLESVSPKVSYLLENRTAHPFQHRQASLGEIMPAFHMVSPVLLPSRPCLASFVAC